MNSLLIPDRHLKRLDGIVSKRRENRNLYLLKEDGYNPVPAWKLSKQIARLLAKNSCRIQKMHALRHGFASWNLVRYYMLVDMQFRGDVRVGRFNLDLDGRHEWFSDVSLANFAEVVGGMPWRINIENGGKCISCATDFIMLSKLLGHMNRFTTLENYTNTLGWVIHYFLLRREIKITGK